MRIEGCPSPVPRASRWRALAAAWLVALVLAACGGGGGDSDGGGSANGGSATGGSAIGGSATGGGTSGGSATGGGTSGGSATGGGTSGGSATGGGTSGGSATGGGTSGGSATGGSASGGSATGGSASGGGTSGGGAGGGATQPDVVWGAVETLEPDTIDFNSADGGPGASDGGTPGGGDGGTPGSGDGGSPAGGDGVGAGGGLGKTLQVRIAVARTSDGASLGSALTGSTSGLVRIKAKPGTAPVLLTLSGTDVGRYFDEGRNALVPYGPDQPPLHSLVTAFDQHLGVTALTEAAYRYALNHFIADPNAVRSGTAPLRRSATADEIARLTATQIQQAQEAIRAEINRAMPDRYQLVSIATLPTPVDGNSGRGKIKNNRHGIAQAVTGGLALVAARFDPSLDRPALTIASQLADDLTDGVIDGMRLDGGSVFAGTRAAYNPITLARDLVAAADTLLDQLGGLPPLPIITAQPMSVVISEGKSATLRVRADGEGLNYQWFAGAVEIAGERSPNYRTGSAGTYRVVVSNAAGTVTSDLATVTLSPREVAPKITKQPKSLTLALGTNATFTVEASGTDLEYQWFDGYGCYRERDHGGPEDDHRRHLPRRGQQQRRFRAKQRRHLDRATALVARTGPGTEAELDVKSLCFKQRKELCGVHVAPKLLHVTARSESWMR